MQFFNKTNIDFISKRYTYFVISALLILFSIGAYIYRGGPNYGIDFTGGMLMQISFEKNVSLQEVRSALDEGGLKSFELQTADRMIMIRAKREVGSQQEFEKTVTNAFATKFADNKITVDRVEYVGPSVGEYLSKQALYAFVFSFLGIIIYVAFRFKSALWGITGVIGIIHNTIICFGMVIITGKEVDIIVIAGLLTVAGYSINDTIVLFDRMRENMRLSIKDDFGTIVNKSINAVLLRTVVTSITVFIVSCSLFFLGGEVIHTFAYIMVVGTSIATFSTIFLCAPLVYEWETRKRNRAKAARQQQTFSKVK
ncbi:MAG: protein translocase subunit SecF [Endomicrobia bacterium]|nr:protein translocase subunit SecF [Endomicrobiia bacterium]MCL2506405.1 protein translocase subunit SecF [Endomicrobiia bacterium]